MRISQVPTAINLKKTNILCRLELSFVVNRTSSFKGPGTLPHGFLVVPTGVILAIPTLSMIQGGTFWWGEQDANGV